MIVPASPGSSVLARVGVAPWPQWQSRPDEQSSLMALWPCWKGPQHAPISTRDLEPQ
jgi:hypothetical protein